ncbi:MAG: sulfotransferase [Geminicoccaceae bacterium]
MAVFVIGPPRSGTTLLSFMLDRHSALAVMVESHLFGFYRSVAEQLGDRFPELWRELAPRMAASRPLAYIEPAIDPTALDRWPIATYADLARAILESWAAQRGKAIWVEKTPCHTLSWRYLLDHFPDARFVAIIRDPRPSAASLLRARFGTSAISAATRRWVSHCEAIEELRRAAPHRLHLLRYEGLVRQPQAEMTRVCSFLGIGFEAAMLTPHPSSRVMTDAVNRRHLDSRVIRQDTQQWRLSMPGYQQRICSSIAHATGRRLGLDIGDATVSAHDRLLDRLDLARLVVKKARNLQGQAEQLDQARLLLWA